MKIASFANIHIFAGPISLIEKDLVLVAKYKTPVYVCEATNKQHVLKPPAICQRSHVGKVSYCLLVQNWKFYFLFQSP